MTKTIEEVRGIINNAPGLGEYLKRCTGPRKRLTAIESDEKSGYVAYSVHCETQTLTMPSGLTTIGLFKDNRYQEKYFSCDSVTYLRIDDFTEAKSLGHISVQAGNRGSSKLLEFLPSDFKDCE